MQQGNTLKIHVTELLVCIFSYTWCLGQIQALEEKLVRTGKTGRGHALHEKKKKPQKDKMYCRHSFFITGS